MSVQDIPVRSNGDRITAAWFNTIRSELVNSGLGGSYAVKTSDYTVVSDDSAIGIDTTSTSVTITLPSASGVNGKRLSFLVVDLSNAAIVDANGAETINGIANYTFTKKFEAVTLISDGTEWKIINKAETLHKFNGTTAPTVNEDADDGYSVGSFWYDITNDKMYFCIDSSAGAAIWKPSSGVLNKYDATVAPTVNEDSDDDYSVGSVWIDITNDNIYICVDASVGAAIWKPIQGLKNKLDGTVAPDENNDSTEGYSVGSLWIDVTGDSFYICVDNTSTAAVWSSGGGSGSGGINHITNYDFETNIDGWSTYKDAAGVAPVDGTGGTANITFAQNTSTVLRGDGDGLITKDGSNRQGEGVSYDFTIDNTDKHSIQVISFDYKTSANYDDAMMRIYIYDVTNSNLIECVARDLSAGEFLTYTGTFQTAPDSTSYRLIFHVADTTTDAFTINIDNVSVGPANYISGPPVTDWKDYTPILTHISGGATNATTQGKWKRVGGELHARMTVTFSAASAAFNQIILSIPAGLTIDITKLPTLSTDNELYIGQSFSVDTGSNTYLGDARYYSNRALLQYHAPNNSSAAFFSQAAPFTFGANDSITAVIKVPIVGWSSNCVMSSTTMNREIAVTGESNGGTALTADVTDIDFTETLDTTAAWSGTQFTAPESGRYQVSGMAYFTAPAARGFKVFIDGSYSKTIGWSPSTAYGMAFNSTIELVKGEVLSFRIYPTSTLQAGASLHHLGITNLNTGTQTIMASEKVGAKYSISSGQSIAHGASYSTIIFDTKIIDTHNTFNASTGIFTAPMSGMYAVDAIVNLNVSAPAGTNAEVYRRIYDETNTSAIAVGKSYIVSSLSRVQAYPLSTLISLDKGQQVSFGFLQLDGKTHSLSTVAAENWISIYSI